MKTIMMWGILGLVNFAVGNVVVGFACVGCQLVAAAGQIVERAEENE
jgi:hypothetical protein